MIKEYLEKNNFAGYCPVRDVLNRVGDKWSILIISVLGEFGTMRFNQINSTISGISQKMLTVTLKTLEADGLISRKIYPQVPPRVEYTLTPLGQSLLPAITTLAEWAIENMPAVLSSRESFASKSI
jgi:DNA-binding HxlR family transcriptional regulator